MKKTAFGKKSEKSKILILRNTAIITASLLAVIILFELSLKFSGYGINTEPFTKVNINGSHFYRDNIHFVNKYYPGAFKHIVSEERNLFPADKEAGTVRGFIIGGSAAGGFPYNSNQSFGGIIKKALENSGYYGRADIINLSFNSMSSYYIADVSKKLLKYEPDFIIIYTGENEYYDIIRGGVSVSHTKIKLNLMLKEFKIYQLIQNKTVKTDPSYYNDFSFIDNQVTEDFFITDSKNDSSVKERFIKNINKTITFLNKKEIPVVLTETLSNIFDMPPFSGENDDKISDFISEYKALIEKSDLAGLEQKLNQSQILDLYRRNANVNYLNGLSANMIYKNSLEALNFFLTASEQDTTPLRVKGSLFGSLNKDHIANRRKFKNLRILSLRQMVLGLNELSFLGNILSADHTHLNNHGSRIAAYYILTALSELLDLEETKVLSYFNNTQEKINKDLFISDTDHFSAFLNTYDIYKSSIFSQMLIPYKIDPVIDLENLIISSKELYDIVKELSGKDIYIESGYYFYNKKDFDKSYEIAKSFVTNYPSSDDARYFMAQVFDKIGHYNSAKQEVTIGYALSDRNLKKYEIAKMILSQEELKKLIKNSGKPVF